jgi:Na+-driven multidrug efflux pump
MEAISTALVFGLPVILPTFIGQNLGAGNAQRAGAGVLLGVRQVALAQLAIAGVLALGAAFLALPFSESAEVRGAIELFLYFVPISATMDVITCATAGTFIALGRMREYLLIGALPCFWFVAMTWAGAEIAGMPGLVIGLSLARIVLGAACLRWLFSVLRSAGMQPARPAPGAVVS